MKVVSGVKVGDMKHPDPSKRGQVDVVDFPVKPVGPEDVKIKVAYCSICGSDPHIVGGAFGLEPPFGLGHEMSGVVVELGENATRKGLKIGDHVSGNFLSYCGSCYDCLTGHPDYCEYTGNEPCMAEYVVWHESQVVKLPEGVSLLKGCLTEPVSIGVRIMDKSNLQTGGTALVSGGGPIGLIVCQLFKMRGATSLTLSEPIQERRDIAKSYGVDYLINPMSDNLFERGMEITGGRGYDVIVEVSGVPSAAENVLPLAAKHGTILYSAMFPTDYKLPLNLFDYCYHRQVTITGTYCTLYNFERSVQILKNMNLEAFLSPEQIFDIDDCKAAFEAQISGQYPKIIIRCNAIDEE